MTVIARALVLLLSGLAVHAAEQQALLGAADFIPSRENAVGWRGNGLGNFMGATPPAWWSDGTQIKVTKDAKGKRQLLYTRPQDAKMRNILWRVVLPNWSNSSPIVVGNKVLLMCEGIEGFPLLLCMHADTGKEVWRQEISPLHNEDEATRLRVSKAWSRYYQLARTYNLLHHDGVTIQRHLKSKPESEYWLTKKQNWDTRASTHDFNIVGEAKKRSFTCNLTEADAQFIRTMAKWGCGFATWDAGMRNHRGTWSLSGGGFGAGAYVGYSFPTPISDGHWVWVYTGNNTVACLDMHGAIRWSRRLGPVDFTTWYNYIQSPVLIGDTLLVSSNQALTALDADTGQLRWQQKSESRHGKKSANDERAKARQSHFLTGAKIRINNEWYFFWDDARLYRVRDGNQSKRIIDASIKLYGCFSALVRGQSLICAVDKEGKEQGKTIRRFDFHLAGNELVFKEVWRQSGKPGRKGYNFGKGDSGPMDGIWHGNTLYIGAGNQNTTSHYLTLDDRTGNIQRRIPLAAARLGGPVKTASGMLAISIKPDSKAATGMAGLVDFAGNALGHSLMHSLPESPERKALARGFTSKPYWGCNWNGAWHSGLFPHGNRVYFRSREHLYCVQSERHGMPGDDHELGKQIRAGQDADLVKKHILDAKAYYRFCAVFAAQHNPALATANIDSLEKLALSDPDPELRAQALDALTTADPHAKLLCRILKDMDDRFSWDADSRGFHQQSVLHLPTRSQLKALQNVDTAMGRYMAEALLPLCRRLAVSEPQTVFAMVAHVFQAKGWHDTMAGPYLALIAEAGDHAKPVVMGLTNAIDRLRTNNWYEACRLVKALDPDRFEAIAGQQLKRVQGAIDAFITSDKPRDRIAQHLYWELRMLDLLGERRQNVVPALKTYAASEQTKTDDRKFVLMLIDDIEQKIPNTR